MANTDKGGDPLSKGLGMAIALGALAVGAAAAFLNNERTRQMREDLQRQISDVSNRLDREMTARRPEIEDAIQRGRQAAVEGLERVRGAVEQGADRAQEYVQRASSKTSDTAVDLRDTSTSAADQAANKAEDTVDSISTKAESALDDTSGGTQETWTNATLKAEASTESGGEDTMSNMGNETGGNVSDNNPHTQQADRDDLADPAREQVAESGSAFSDFVGSAGGTIGSATVESAQAMDDAAYDQEHGVSAGENLDSDSPGMADYRGDTSYNADIQIERPGEGGNNPQ